ncbi:MAG: hypothetical protein ACJ77A_14865 [Actinomycetota bacterium]
MAGLVIASLAAVGVLLFLYLSPYFANRYHVSVGNDAPQYLARARIVAGGGLNALANAFPAPLTANPDRPGYPVIANLLDSTLGITPDRLAFMFSAVLSVVIGLAAAAFARMAMEEPPWSFPVYALLVGGSTSTALTAIGHVDNLMVDALLLAGAAAALMVADGRRVMPAAILLLGSTAIVHWNFGLLFAAVLGVFTAALVPASVMALRRGTRIVDTPAARMAGLLAGAGVVGGAAFLPLPGAPHLVQLPRAQLAVDYARASSKYRLPIFGALGAVGAAALPLVHRSRRRIYALVLLVLWAAVGLLAIVLFDRGSAIPAHRLLPFAYGIPVLAAAGVVGLARLAGERLRRFGRAAGAAGRVVGVVVVVAGLVLSVVVAYRILSVRKPFLSDTALQETATAASYASTVAAGRPVVLVVDRPDQGAATLYGVAPAYRWTSAWLPPGDRSRLYVYLGSAANLMAGRPSPGPDSLFDQTSTTLWRSIRPIPSDQLIVVEMKSFNRHFYKFIKRHPGSQVAPRVAVFGSRMPSAGTLTVPRLPDPPRNSSLVVLAVLTLLGLAVAGMGWSSSLLPTGWLERVGCAPAFGIAALALGGYAADRLGVRLTGASGAGVALAVTVLGFAPLAVRSVRRRRGPSVAPGRGEGAPGPGEASPGRGARRA